MVADDGTADRPDVGPAGNGAAGAGIRLSAVEARVVGCLIEKQLATPASYPLTVNALVAACNQTSNRFPVVRYDDATVERALRNLREHGLTRIVYSPQNRAPKHRHVLDEVLEVDSRELAVLAVLLLRGPQTPGELRARTERLTPFGTLGEVDEVLERLAARPAPLVVRLERQPGQKEARYAHLLAGDPPSDPPSDPSPAPAASPAAAPNAAPVPLEAYRDGDTGRLPVPGDAVAPDATARRLAALEVEVAELRAAVRRLEEELGVAPEQPGHVGDEVPY